MAKGHELSLPPLEPPGPTPTSPLRDRLGPSPKAAGGTIRRYFRSLLMRLPFPAGVDAGDQERTQHLARGIGPLRVGIEPAVLPPDQAWPPP